MVPKSIFNSVRENIEAVIAKKQPIGLALWDAFIQLHPADIAAFFAGLDRDLCRRFFIKLPRALQIRIFQEFSESLKVFTLSFLSDVQRSDIL
ncbi:MAG: hypothetical protein ACE5EK_09120 [Nitrospinales bacterium]